MREIKFRGVADRESGGIELVYGNLSTNSSNNCVYKDTHPDRISWRTETGAFANKPIRKGTRMQFTGLKDKNGVEVYEGDIVTCDSFDGNGSEVYWTEAELRWRCVNSEGNILQITTELFELLEMYVIGNIYENPELRITSPPNKSL